MHRVMGIHQHLVNGARNATRHLIKVGLELGVVGLLNSPVGRTPDGTSPGKHHSQADADLAFGHPGMQLRGPHRRK